MIPLPPVPPVTGWHRTVRLPRDYYVRLDGNDYSVDPAVIGRRVEVTADLCRIRVTCDGLIAADHERIWPSTRPSPTPRTWPPRRRCRLPAGWRRSPAPATPRSSGGT